MSMSTVVRLNDPEYGAAGFTAHGIAHLDLPFDDCSATPARVAAAVLDAVRCSTSGAVAPHCRAGLGRTGTLAAALAAHGFKFSASEAMGWLRIVRLRSVIGEQQRFLCDLERHSPAANKELGTGTLKLALRASSAATP